MELGDSEDDDDLDSSAEEGSDSEPMIEDLPPDHSQRRLRKPRSGSKSGIGSSAAAARQRNLKQKFVALLKKFKVTDPEDLDQDRSSLDRKLSGECKRRKAVYLKV